MIFSGQILAQNLKFFSDVIAQVNFVWSKISLRAKWISNTVWNVFILNCWRNWAKISEIYFFWCLICYLILKTIAPKQLNSLSSNLEGLLFLSRCRDWAQICKISIIIKILRYESTPYFSGHLLQYCWMDWI